MWGVKIVLFSWYSQDVKFVFIFFNKVQVLKEKGNNI